MNACQLSFICLIIFEILLQCKAAYSAKSKPRIAIIGGGVDGAISAYYLKNRLLGKVNIDIYDQNSTDKFDNNGRILHHYQIYIPELVNKFGFGFKLLYPKGKPIIWDGSKNSIMNASILKNNYPELFEELVKELNETSEKFEVIYKFQKDKIFFQTVKDMLSKIDQKFADYLGKSTKTVFDKYISQNEEFSKLLNAIVFSNYRQNLNAHAFAGISSFWFSELCAPISMIITDPDIIVKRMLDKKINYHIFETITKISREGNAYVIHSGKERSVRYDFIILATSSIDDGIEFCKKIRKPKIRKYQKLIMTPIEGKLRDSLPGSELQNIQETPDFIDIPNKLFIAKNSLISTDDYWAIFSSSPMKKKDACKWFSTCDVMEPLEVHHYPDYSDFVSAQSASFVLGPHFYHLKAIEWASVSLEMTAISANNIALLIENEIEPKKKSTPKKSKNGKQ